MNKKEKRNFIIDVQPIRDLQKLEDMKWSLKRHCSIRDYILFNFGINTGLRVGDLLKLKVKDVKNKERLIIKEGKTKKMRTIHLPKELQEELNNYIEGLHSSWLFPSRKGTGPITRVQAYRQLQKAADFAGLESIGTHTMRKTFGYWFYKRTLDVAKLQKILNHSRPDITLRYIGIEEEEILNSLEGFYL